MERDCLLQCLEQTKQTGCFADTAELDAESLHLDEEIFDVDDFATNQRLEKHAHQPHQPCLHVPILDVLARRDAVRHVQVDELGGQIYGPIDWIGRE